MDMNDYVLGVLARERLAEMRARGERLSRIRAASQQPRRLRSALGQALVRLGKRLYGPGVSSRRTIETHGAVHG